MNAIRVSDPQPGHYKMRLVKGGPFVPVRIYLWLGQPLDPANPPKRGETVYRALVGDEERDVFETWIGCAGRPISPAEYDYMVAMRRHAMQHEPDLPEAAPRSPIDLNQMPTLF